MIANDFSFLQKKVSKKPQQDNITLQGQKWHFETGLNYPLIPNNAQLIHKNVNVYIQVRN